MYSYTYDKETGGILLNSTPTVFSKEPRPVYAPELDLLGFNQYWSYDSHSKLPYMWAESVQYWYRGKPVAKLKGGDLFSPPEIVLTLDEAGRVVEPEPEGSPLKPIDIEGMIKANEEFLSLLEASTVKKILNVFEKRNASLDIFHVAFSGGKDSAVLLDLVKKALPKKSFVVVFGDTGMEFPDTYKVIEETKQLCEQDGVSFYTAKSHFTPKESWLIFGPPARVIRWCCSVHKSTPQTLLLREVTGKDDYVGLDFVGVRKHESLARSKYSYESYGEKQKGQYSHNPILDWTSAEVWLYIYANHLPINEAYKKGNPRAGCLCCPMGGGASDYVRHRSYQDEVDKYIELIKDSYAEHGSKTAESYVANGGWNARRNGRELVDNEFRCVERVIDGVQRIEVTSPTSDWREWIKTLGTLRDNDSSLSIELDDETIGFELIENDSGYTVMLPESVIKAKPSFGKLFKQVFRKASYCVGCRVCETNCRRGCISFSHGKVAIENCIQCHQCHEVDSGCLLFHSRRHPQGGGRTMKSLNSFADHAPKPEWLQSYFDLKDDFFTDHSLGPMMYDMFRRFLRDAGLNEKNHFTEFAELISQIGWETDTAMGLVMSNLMCCNPQMQWYVRNMEVGVPYQRSLIEEMLCAEDVKPKDAKSIAKAFKRITDTPIGTNLNFGYVSEDNTMMRTECSISDPKVYLYALFKFCETCNAPREFTLQWILNDEGIERSTVSPSLLFGIDYESTKSIMMGLAAKYPEFINASFTNDLETIELKDKSSSDVLNLFKEEL